jgi:acyl-CoA oxidase
MARLLVGTRDHGVHPFIVQLRSLEDHTLLPGIEAGDVGPKLGYNETDNGYCSFFHVRIPRSHMLSGLSRLDRDSTYHPSVHNKLSYGTMILIRNKMSRTVAFQLAQAITIATRYSIIREQGTLEGGTTTPVVKETSIIHYRTQHSRLLTHLSSAFALIFASEICDAIYEDLVQRQNLPSGTDNSTLAYTHATTASMKAYATSLAADGTEDARRLCGGHGFASISGLPELVTLVVAATTFEGENYVMYLQTARYLIKCASEIRTGQSVPMQMSYLSVGYHQWYATGASQSSSTAKKEEFLDPAIQQEAFEHRAVRLIFDAEAALAQSQQEGMSKEAAWNRHGLELTRASRAHTELFVLRCFHSKLEDLRSSPSSCPKPALLQLERLASLYALTAIESPTSGGSVHFFEDGYISSHQLADIRLLIDQLLGRLLPDAVTLTDAWDFSDGDLQSALGCYDGNVYERMMQWIKQLPINRQAATQGDVDRLGYEQSIRPLVTAARL